SCPILRKEGRFLDRPVGILGNLGTLLTALLCQAIAILGVGSLMDEFYFHKALIDHAPKQWLILVNSGAVLQLGNRPVGQETGALIGVVEVSEVKRLVELYLPRPFPVADPQDPKDHLLRGRARHSAFLPFSPRLTKSMALADRTQPVSITYSKG